MKHTTTKKVYRIIILLLVLLAGSTSSYSQISPVQINGKVLDGGTGKALPFTIIGLRTDRAVIKGELSDSSGGYVFRNLRPGHYSMIMSHLNYKRDTISFLARRDTVIDIKMKPLVNQLKGVTIHGDKPLIERKIDRYIYHVKDNPATEGADAIDILKSSPLLNVEMNQINIIGKGEAKVLINGRLIHLSGKDLFNYLNTIPINSIDRIEIITNPPARYDAEGNSGLINIITNATTSEKLLFGNISTAYEQSFYPTGEISGNLNGNTRVVDFNLGAGYRKGRKNPYETQHTAYPLEYWDGINFRKQYTSLYGI